MENTLGNKAKVFALYWGQEVLKAHTTQGTKVVGNRNYGIYRDQFLELKPISSISDEDAIEGAIITQGINCDGDITDIRRYEDFVSFSITHEGNNFKTLYSFFFYQSSPIKLKSNQADYLRSKGYALPAFGLSVEELVKRGWFVLT